MKYTVNPKLSLLENLCEICLGERLPSDILDPSGVTLIPANTKLSKTRLKIIALYRGRGVDIPTAKDAEENINAILLFPYPMKTKYSKQQIMAARNIFQVIFHDGFKQWRLHEFSPSGEFINCTSSDLSFRSIQNAKRLCEAGHWIVQVEEDMQDLETGDLPSDA